MQTAPHQTDQALKWTKEFLAIANDIQRTHPDAVRHTLDLAVGIACCGTLMAAFFAKTATPPPGEPFIDPENFKKEFFKYLEAQFDGLMRERGHHAPRIVITNLPLACIRASRWACSLVLSRICCLLHSNKRHAK